MGNMKKSLTWAGIPLAVNVVAMVVFLVILPDQVPLHFGVSGEANRFGSKYENLVFLALALGFGILFALLAKFGEEGNRVAMAKLNIAMQGVFALVGVLIGLNQLSYGDGAGAASASSADMSQISALVIGTTFVIMGSLMPKSTRNGTFGIRVPWTQKSDEAWRREHRFGGPVTIAAGALMMLAGLVFAGSVAFAVMAIVFIAWVVACFVGSYFICKDTN